MTHPNNPPTDRPAGTGPPALADALAPGLDAEERTRRIKVLTENSKNPALLWQEIPWLLEAHARDARRKALEEARDKVCQYCHLGHTLTSSGIHSCGVVCHASVIRYILDKEFPNAQQ